MEQPGRVRDSMATLPFLPAMHELGRDGQRSAEWRAGEKQARLLTNRAVAAIRSCWDGDFHGDFSLKEYWDNSWRLAGPQSRLIVENIHLQFRAFQQPEGTPQGEDAFRRVMLGIPGYGCSLSTTDSQAGELPRGAMCPAVVDEMAIPPPGKALDPTTTSPTLQYYYKNALRMMLREQHQIDWELYNSISQYQDPNLDDPAVMIRAVVRMYLGGMVGFSEDCHQNISLFTVMKKYVTQEDGSKIPSTRLVWDARRINVLFNAPPDLAYV